MFDVIVIGAGVSGLLASGKLAQRGFSVLLLEKMEKPARKLRITGKGRCNITNVASVEGHLEKLKTDQEFVRFALQEFDNKEVISFFASIGVPTKIERGNRVFPVSDSAVDLALSYVKWVEKSGVKIKCNVKVDSIIRNDDTIFEVNCGVDHFQARNIVIACGGASYPSTGSTGDGYEIAYDLGHNIIPIRPSLVPLVVENCEDFEGLDLRNVGVNLLINNTLVGNKFGDVDFTRSGISGATILQLSGTVVDAIIDNKMVRIELDLKPALSFVKLNGRIDRELDALNSAPFKVMLQKLVPSQLHKTISTQLQIPLNKQISSIPRVKFDELIQLLKQFPVNIVDYCSFKEAIVTAGGVDTNEVDPLTMQSKIVKGLYFCGEVLDIDADTGGFNIQLALSTAALVANSIQK